MKNIITPRFTEKQAQIDLKRKEIVDHYPEVWAAMISEWNTPFPDDRVWMMSSANYLFRTGGVHWAIDPLSLNWRIAEAAKVDLAYDLQNLSFVLITHSHIDHLDFNLIAACQELPIRWIVPDFLVSTMQERVNLPASRMTIAHAGNRLELEGFRITPFEGQHQATQPDGRTTGVPEMGYLVEQSKKRWLFPGDTRIYDAKRLPDFGPVDVLFAHLWLGRGSACWNHHRYWMHFASFALICALLKLSLPICMNGDAMHMIFGMGRMCSKFSSNFSAIHRQSRSHPPYLGKSLRL